ncbi:cation:proton antiporter family protein [Marinobacterium stanieri]|uniref:Transporter, CPA2 family n=1 Tax=Marinobacterium stanieri TaxID=49186 RepID=A0A1N6P656_9GAMM|nr:cation:proton antiporter family protein [Marinobacterium stanieri]SIP99878.1 transporter, CPA2 family [Marinobacterium stanieri]
MIEAVWITFAFGLGMGVKLVGLPPLIGYLAAGFAIVAAGDMAGIEVEGTEALSHIAHLGVLLLLFTVGLKLKVRNLVKPEVIGGGVMHFGISILLFTPAIHWIMGLEWMTALMLGIALSFSSTVLAAKVLESKRELRAFHGRVAIGILIVQDLLALLVMALASGKTPSVWALLVFGIPLLRPLFYKLLDISGHEELLVLLGLLLALVIGGKGFELVGLSSELGALAFGALLANHRRAGELSSSLWSIKEVFLVGFFLQIGMGGLPDADALVFAIVMGLVLPLKGILFFFLLLLFKLRARSAFLSGLSLTNYSEFGLIVASIVLPEWLVPLAIAVSVSFLVSAPLYRAAHPLYDRLGTYLTRFEREGFHPDEQPLSLGEAEILVIGMGRTGTAAYDHLVPRNIPMVAVDSDPAKVDAHAKAGRNVVFADAEDVQLWKNLKAPKLKHVILAASDVEAKVTAARQLRQAGFEGVIVAHSMFADHADAITKAGADHTYQTMAETGVGLAEHIFTAVKKREEGTA